LFNVDGTFFALDQTYTHRGGPLAEGEISGHEVTCPWHGARFDVRTGEVVGPPA
jgi:nitrite reductase/ring-hydroxylating ferredoxin subunit